MNKTTKELVYKYWFPRKANKIYIVASRVKNPPSWAYVLSKDYSYLDKMGDKDLVFEVTKFLSRFYPSAEIRTYFADDAFTQQDFKSNNIFIAGGPRWNNKICQDFMWDDKIKSIFRYPPPKDVKHEVCKGCKFVESECDRECICVNKKLIKYNVVNIRVPTDQLLNYGMMDDARKNICGEYTEIKDCLSVDYGFFAAFDNQFNLRNVSTRVVIANGIHTFGGMGAFLSFSDTPIAIKNFQEIEAKFIGNDFFAYFPVKVDIGNYRDPIMPIRLENLNVFSLIDTEKTIRGNIKDNVLKIDNDFESNKELFERSILNKIDECNNIINNNNYTHMHENKQDEIRVLEGIYRKVRMAVSEDEMSELRDKYEKTKEG